jgi:hypothetical protein
VAPMPMAHPARPSPGAGRRAWPGCGWSRAASHSWYAGGWRQYGRSNSVTRDVLVFYAVRILTATATRRALRSVKLAHFSARCTRASISSGVISPAARRPYPPGSISGRVRRSGSRQEKRMRQRVRWRRRLLRSVDIIRASVQFPLGAETAPVSSSVNVLNTQ